MENALLLAREVHATATDDWKYLNLESDCYIISVSDDAIAAIAEQLSRIIPSSAIVTHTSGATSSEVFKEHFEHYGVFYPLQTFSKNRQANFEKLPFCIGASNQYTENQLVKLAKTICPNVYLIDDKQRAVLHVAAVFANNFTNHLLTISETILVKENIPFDLLKPLISETIDKIKTHTPEIMQTGPARRGDKVTLKRHETYLEKYPTYQKIYEILSKSIEGFYKN